MLLLLVAFCFTLSGFAALVYQTAWMRLFSIAFGTSEVAVVIVLAGYMAGLAAGAAIAARLIDRIRRPVLVYGGLEGTIALAALAMPLLVGLTGELYGALVGGQPSPPDAGTFGQPLFYSIAAFLALLLPTAPMGATLPLLARFAVTSNSNLGPRVSMLYSVNTLGAVAGTIVAGFVLLPAYGLRGTIWFGVAANFLVFLLAVWLSRLATEQEGEGPPQWKTQNPEGAGFVLPLIALSGVLSFIYEVLWMRMLSHVLGSSVYAFSTMLAAFLAGIALGSAAAGFVARSPRRAGYLFACCQFGIAITSAFVYWRLQVSLPADSANAVLAFAVMFPSTLFIGATFPLAVRIHAGSADEAGRSSGLVYSWNMVGAIIGAFIGGFIIIPSLGFAGTARFAVLANVAIGIATLMLAIRRKDWVIWNRRLIAAAVIAALATVTLFNPSRPDTLVTRAIFGGSGMGTVREHYYAVGRSSTVYLTENDARFDLSTNGLPEAQVEFKGAPPYILSQRWLGMWPSLARPETESLLVVGLGGGIVLEGIPGSVTDVDVVELEAEVINANRLVRSRRSYDPLGDPRMNLVVNDARNALRLTDKTYDAVVSQPSHPWTAGASHLFTREFFAQVKERLKPGGVFVQWMNAEFLDEILLRRLAATVRSEFEYVRIYQPTSLALHFVASNEPLDIETGVATSGKPLLDEPGHYSRNGISGATDLIATLLVDDEGVNRMVAEIEPISDDDNRMVFDTNVLAEGIGVDRLTNLTAEFDPLLNPSSWLRRILLDSDIVLIAWRLTVDGQTPRLERLIETIHAESTRRVLRAILLRYRGLNSQAEALLARVDTSSGVYQEAAFLRIVDKLPSIASGALGVDQLPDLGVEQSRLGPVLLGWRALRQRDWQALLELDQALDETRMSELWAPYAAQLRAEWRLRSVDPEGRLAAEALEIIDRAIAMHATLDAYSLRAQIGIKLGNGPIFIESTAFVLGSIEQRLWEVEYFGGGLTRVERELILSRLDVLEAELVRRVAPDYTGRAERVLENLRRVRVKMDR